MARKAGKRRSARSRGRKGRGRRAAKTVKIVIAGPRNQRRRKLTRTLRF